MFAFSQSAPSCLPTRPGGRPEQEWSMEKVHCGPGDPPGLGSILHTGGGLNQTGANPRPSPAACGDWWPGGQWPRPEQGPCDSSCPRRLSTGASGTPCARGRPAPSKVLSFGPCWAFHVGRNLVQRACANPTARAPGCGWVAEWPLGGCGSLQRATWPWGCSPDIRTPPTSRHTPQRTARRPRGHVLVGLDPALQAWAFPGKHHS